MSVDASAARQAASRHAALHGLLRGRTALVTGAGRGIGAAIADAFALAGASVTRADIRGGNDVIACDVTDEGAVAAAFGSAGGSLTDVVHAAGIVELGEVAATEPESFRRVIEVNLVGTFLVARQAARCLPRGGNLILIASQAGLRSGALWGAYGAAKGGVLRLADALADELGPKGIRVNTISPGNVETEMMDDALRRLADMQGSTPSALRARYESAIPLGRFAEPGEIGAAAVALCSGLLSYANGANLVLDGGELSR